MNPAKDTQTQSLDIAKQAALDAGKFLKSYYCKTVAVESMIGKDVKLDVDRKSESIILDMLKKNSAYAIFSEESGWTQSPGENEHYWIVDPLDGSLNYLRKIPNCCVSIGLWYKLSPVLGVVYDFNRSEIFSGIAGEGAWLNDSLIKVSSTRNVKDAILCTGFPVNSDSSREGIEEFAGHVSNFKKIRLLGSAALSLAYVAAGKVDAYFERDIMLWDVAGALPIVLGAGGMMDIHKSDSVPNAFSVYAFNRHLRNAIDAEAPR